MSDIKTKIQQIFLPYLIVSIATLIGYTFLHWLLFIKFNVFGVDEGGEGPLVVIVPMAMSCGFTFFWLKEKIRLLNLVDNAYNFFMFITIAVIAVQSIFAQQFIDEATGKLTHLSSIGQIEKKERTKYYSLQHFYLDKKHFSVEKFTKMTGKYNEDLTMLAYFAVPILHSEKDTTGTNVVAWYGIKYKETVNNQSEDQQLFDSFVNKSMSKFDRLNINKFAYLERVGEGEGAYDNFYSAIQKNIKYSTNSQVILIPGDGPFEARYSQDLINTLVTFGGGSLVFLIMALLANLKKPEEETDGIKPSNLSLSPSKYRF